MESSYFIGGISHSQIHPIKMHEYHTAAMAEQSARRDWILTNWRDVIQLNQGDCRAQG